MTDIEIRTATATDIAALYDGPVKRSIRAVVVTVDGVPLGLGGVYYEEDRVIGFARIKADLRAYPFAIYKAALAVMAMIDRRAATVVAVADQCVPRSKQFLEHLGFQQIEGEVYQWISTHQPTS